MNISRRELLKYSIALALTNGSCGFSNKHSRNSLNICNWADYVHPSLIKEFEHKYDIKVNYDTFSSNEALFAKSLAAKNQYDVIVPTSYMLSQMKRLNFLAEINHKKLKNLKYVMPKFFNTSIDYGLEYSIPFAWGTTGIAYNEKKLYKIFNNSLPSDLNDFAIFSNPKLSGYVTMLDDQRETIGFALKSFGFSFNSIEDDKIAIATKALISQKTNLMCYTSDQVIIQLSGQDSYLALAYSGDAFQAFRQNNHIKYIIPRQGSSIWVDYWCIPKNAKRYDLAHLWIDFMLEPKNALKNALFNGYATINQIAYENLPSDIKNNPNFYPNDILFGKCEELIDIGDGIYIYNKYWNQIKTA